MAKLDWAKEAARLRKIADQLNAMGDRFWRVREDEHLGWPMTLHDEASRIRERADELERKLDYRLYHEKKRNSLLEHWMRNRGITDRAGD
jgi:hypothetical protein